MSYYHDTKDAALLAGALYATAFHTRAELEPHNGWVLVLTPKDKSVFDYAIGPVLEHAEIDLSGYTRLRKRPAGHKRPPHPEPKQVAKAKSKTEDVEPTWKPGDKLPW